MRAIQAGKCSGPSRYPIAVTSQSPPSPGEIYADQSASNLDTDTGFVFAFWDVTTFWLAGENLSLQNKMA